MLERPTTFMVVSEGNGSDNDEKEGVNSGPCVSDSNVDVEGNGRQVSCVVSDQVDSLVVEHNDLAVDSVAAGTTGNGTNFGTEQQIDFR